jgi:predicted DNA-binding ribbon-helix-helix protein
MMAGRFSSQCSGALVFEEAFLSTEECRMKSPVVKRSVVVGGHKTSVSLEEAFWNGMKEISGERGKTLSELVSEIDHNRELGNLSSAIRLFVLDHFRAGVPMPSAASGPELGQWPG